MKNKTKTTFRSALLSWGKKKDQEAQKIVESVMERAHYSTNEINDFLNSFKEDLLGASSDPCRERYIINNAVQNVINCL